MKDEADGCKSIFIKINNYAILRHLAYPKSLLWLAETFAIGSITALIPVKHIRAFLDFLGDRLQDKPIKGSIKVGDNEVAFEVKSRQLIFQLILEVTMVYSLLKMERFLQLLSLLKTATRSTV